MIFIYTLIFTAIFAYTFTWLWYIKAYMQYDFGTYYKYKYTNALNEEQEQSACEDYLKNRNNRCSTVMKMIFLAGPFAWIILIMVTLVGKLVVKVDKDYVATGTEIL